MLVGADQDQFQLATEEVDITPAQVEDVPVEVTGAAIHIEGEVVEAGVIQPEIAGAAFDAAKVSNG